MILSIAEWDEPNDCLRGRVVHRPLLAIVTPPGANPKLLIVKEMPGNSFAALRANL
jgi:hypothetical protein